MSITLTCPSCGQMCAVADEHAGKQVACPRCRGVISVPAAATAPTGTAPVAGTAPAASVGTPLGIPPPPPPTAGSSPLAFESAQPPPPSAPSPGTPPAPPLRGALAGLDDAAKALGLDQFSKILLFAGWGCLCLLALTTLLPWRASIRIGTEDLSLS